MTKGSGKTLYYPGGGVTGFSAVIQRYPSERLGIVALTNIDPSKPWERADQIAADLFGASPQPTKEIGNTLVQGDTA